MKTELLPIEEPILSQIHELGDIISETFPFKMEFEYTDNVKSDNFDDEKFSDYSKSLRTKVRVIFTQKEFGDRTPIQVDEKSGKRMKINAGWRKRPYVDISFQQSQMQLRVDVHFFGFDWRNYRGKLWNTFVPLKYNGFERDPKYGGIGSLWLYTIKPDLEHIAKYYGSLLVTK